jgi:TonB family protein
MKNQLLAFISLLIISSLLAFNAKKSPVDDNKAQLDRIEKLLNEIHVKLKITPTPPSSTEAVFPGGTKEMHSFFEKNSKYPSAAMRANVSGKVFVKFAVDSTGKVNNIQILKGLGFGCDEETQRVILSMPRFIPATKDGLKINSSITTPFIFRLE